MKNDRVLSYIVFDGDWGRVVDLSAEERRVLSKNYYGTEDVLPFYLEYLEGSLRSLAATCWSRCPQVRVWLIPIEGKLRPETLRARLTAAAPGLALDIVSVDSSFALPFIGHVLLLPENCRAPNNLHEAAMFLALRDSPERFVFFADPDLTFIALGAFDRFVDRLAANPGKLAAGFIEPAWCDPNGFAFRERLHTVACAFDAEAMRREFPIQLFTEPTPPHVRNVLLKDDLAALEYYRQGGKCDSLSLFTDWARALGQPDRILNMNGMMDCYAERSYLTLVCEDMVHCKYLSPFAAKPLEEAIAAAGVPSTPLLEFVRAKARQSSGCTQ